MSFIHDCVVVCLVNVLYQKYCWSKQKLNGAQVVCCTVSWRGGGFLCLLQIPHISIIRCRINMRNSDEHIQVNLVSPEKL